jgi:hypothetical protein
MKIVLCAAIAVFSLGIAHASDGNGNSATTPLFTSIQNQQVAPSHSVPAQAIAGQNSGAAVQGPDTRSPGQGTWLFRVFSLP